MEFISKVCQKILDSQRYHKRHEDRSGNVAPSTRHCFDDMEITQYHNGQSTYEVLFRGESVGRIPSSDFHNSIRGRESNTKQSFLNS